MSLQLLEKYRTPETDGLKVGNILYLLRNGLTVTECIVKLNLDSSFYKQIKDFNRRMTASFKKT